MRNIYSKHTTKEGEEIRICDMEDSHLFNTINLCCKKIKAAESFLNNPRVTKRVTSGSICAHDNGLDYEELVDLAKETIEQLTNLLPAYCMESLRRGEGFRNNISGLISSTFLKSEDPVEMDYGFLSLPQKKSLPYDSNVIDADMCDDF